MKKLILLSVLIIINLNIFSTEYNSNLLGQNLGIKDGSTEYTLKVVTQDDGVTTYLYFKDKLIETKQTISKDNIKTITTTKGNYIQTKKYKDDILIYTETADTKVYYEYSNNKLITKKILINDTLDSISKYYYADNKLIAILTANNNESVYEGFSVDGNVFYKSVDNNFKSIEIANRQLISKNYEADKILSSTDIEKTDDYTIFTSKNQDILKKEYYDIKGNLVKIENYDINDKLIDLTENQYNENNKRIQIKKTEYKEDVLLKSKKSVLITITSLNNDVIESSKSFENNILINEIFYLNGIKKSEILYKNGKKYCTIDYSADGKKVLSIKYSEEYYD